MIRRAIAFIALSLGFTLVGAQETTIRVLAVHEQATTTSSIPAHMARIGGVWFASAPSTPVTITLANGGIPIELPGGGLVGGDPYLQMQDASARVAALRNLWAADIVLVYVDDLPGSGLICGAAFQDYWTDLNGPGFFFPTGLPPMDRRGDDEFFVGLVATDASQCRTDYNITPHEFGHLLGAGHERIDNGQVNNIGFYLYDDSHADLKLPRPGRNGTTPGSRTVMATPNPSGCGTFGEDCPYFNVYSSNLTWQPLNTLNANIHAIEDTALSVANYVTHTPGCQLTAPINVWGEILAVCEPLNGDTTHTVHWQDSCELATSYYRLHYLQPAQPLGGNDLDYVALPGITPAPLLSQNVIVSGADSDIKVQACNDDNECSWLSLSYYVATSQCDP